MIKQFSASKIKLLILLSLGLLLFAGCQAEVHYQTQVHLQASFPIPEGLEGYPTDEGEMRYLAWLPEGYGQERNRRYPLIVFLHGSGTGSYSSEFVIGSGLPGVLQRGEQPENFEFVVISPQAFDGANWWTGDTTKILAALLDEILATYLVDPQRVYLTGLSMGGYGAWILATEYPDYFAAMVSISGSGYKSLTVPEQEVFCEMENVPTWVIHGGRDQFAAAGPTKFYADKLAECGGEVKFTLYPEEDHFGAYKRAYRDAALYAWMLEHEKGER